MEMPSKQRDFVRQAFEIPEAPLDPVDRRIVVMVITPAVVSTIAPVLRQVRTPAAARITVPRNSMAPTVDNGSRSTAR